MDDERKKAREKFAQQAANSAFRKTRNWIVLEPNREYAPRLSKREIWLAVQEFLSPEDRAAGRTLDPRDFPEVSESQVRRWLIIRKERLDQERLEARRAEEEVGAKQVLEAIYSGEDNE